MATPGESRVFEALTAGERATCARRLAELLAETGVAPAVARHLVPVLLTWHMRGWDVMEPGLAALIVGLVEEHGHQIPSGRVYQRFLPPLANRVFGADLFEEGRDGDDSEAEPEPAPDYEDLAFAAASGFDIASWCATPTTVARDACFALQTADWVTAVHAVTCLALVADRSSLAGAVAQFLTDANDYLDAQASLVRSPRLEWELAVYHHTVPRTRPPPVRA